MKRKEAAKRLAMIWESRTDENGTVYVPLTPGLLAKLLDEIGLLDVACGPQLHEYEIAGEDWI